MAKNSCASASWKVTEYISTLKALTSPAVKEIEFTLLSPVGAMFTSSHHLSSSHHPWEAELRLDRDKGLASSHTVEEVAGRP